MLKCSVDKPVKSSAHYPFLDAMRGFIMLQIVLLHAFSIAAQTYLQITEPDKWMKGAYFGFQLLFHDTTLYFTVISGIFYTIVFRKRSLDSYLRSRLANVMSPFAVATLICSLYVVLPLEGPALNATGLGDYLDISASNLVTGGASFQFWYMPVLIVLFALSPVMELVISRMPRFILCLILALPLVASRTSSNLLTTILYFLGAYTAGMLIGRNPLAAVARFTEHLTLLIAALVFTSVLITALEVYDIRFLGPVDLSESAYYVQKLAAFALMFALFYRMENWVSRIQGLKIVASCAFAIYLLHVPIMEFVLFFTRAQWNILDPLHFSALVAIVFVVGLLLSLAIATGARAVAGRYSRYLVGY